jgi:hypothetical protein
MPTKPRWNGPYKNVFLSPVTMTSNGVHVCVSLQSTCRLLLPNDIPWTRIKKKKRSLLGKLHLFTKVSIQTSIKTSAYSQILLTIWDIFQLACKNILHKKFCPQDPTKGGGGGEEPSHDASHLFFSILIFFPSSAVFNDVRATDPLGCQNRKRSSFSVKFSLFFCFAQSRRLVYKLFVCVGEGPCSHVTPR